MTSTNLTTDSFYLTLDQVITLVSFLVVELVAIIGVYWHLRIKLSHAKRTANQALTLAESNADEISELTLLTKATDALAKAIIKRINSDEQHRKTECDLKHKFISSKYIEVKQSAENATEEIKQIAKEFRETIAEVKETLVEVTTILKLKKK